MHGKCSCAKFVGCFHSSDTSKMRTYGLFTKHGSIFHVPAAAAAPDTFHFISCQIWTLLCILSMKRWFQLNRARVAHDAHPAFSSYQNECSKPGRSHHNSDICNLWSLTVLLICLHYDSTVWNLWSGQRRRPISDRVGQYTSSCRAYTAVHVCNCYSVD